MKRVIAFGFAGQPPAFLLFLPWNQPRPPTPILPHYSIKFAILYPFVHEEEQQGHEEGVAHNQRRTDRRI